MKKLTFIGLFSLTFLFVFSCSKDDNYCYECSAHNRFSNETVVRQECDLSKEDRDQQAASFTSAYDNYPEGWTVSCSKTSE